MIKAKSANTKGGDNTSLDGINIEKILEVSRSLMNGSWRPGVARRVLIPKRKSGESRPLTVLSPYDKVVANAIKIVLNFIFEKYDGLDMLLRERYFHNSSHGFRQNRGCHSALKAATLWGLAPWVIQADIYKCFDTIDQKRLVSLLNNTFEDQLLVDTIYKLFQAPVKGVEKGGPDTSKGVGVPQGNPLSPLLANVYLNELDHFIGLLKDEIDKGKQGSLTTKEWRDATYVTAAELSKAKSKKAKGNLKRDLYRKKKKEAEKLGIPRKADTDKQQGNRVFHRLYYVRHADDYLLAFKGPKWLAKEVKKRTEDFLKSNLHFQLKNGELKHWGDNKVHFLGFDIKVPGRKERAIVGTRKILNFKKLRNRLSARKLGMESRLDKALFNTYKSEKLKMLKNLMKGRKIKMSIKEAVRLLSLKDSMELSNLAELKGKKWFYGQKPFKEWLNREYFLLRASWIQKTVLENLGFSSVTIAYEHLIEVMEEARNLNNLNKLKEEEVKRIKVNPNFKQANVDRIIYGKPQGLNPRIYAPVRELKDKMKVWGMLSEGGKPKASGAVFRYHDISIIEYYYQKALGFLNYYKPAVNFYGVKKLADYHLRWSLIHTLAGKHKLKVHEVISKYGKTPKIVLEDRNKKEHILAKFLSSNEINHKPRGFITSLDPVEYKEGLEKPLVKLSLPKTLFAKKCVVINCINTDIEVHHIRVLRRFKYGYLVESIKTSRNKSLSGYAKIESALSRKQIPLCREHHVQWHNLDSSQIDKSYLKNRVEPIIKSSKEV